MRCSTQKWGTPDGDEAELLTALNRQHVRDGSQQDPCALAAWRIRVVNLALQESLPAWKPGSVKQKLLREVARLSYLDSGPLLAKEFLNKSDVHVIFERQRSKTHLDGAAIKLPNGSPLVALTLRHDRLDHFWFTLFHKLAHVVLHLDQDNMEAFFDDLSEEGKDTCEREAEALASDALISHAVWKSARLSTASQPGEILAFASVFQSRWCRKSTFNVDERRRLTDHGLPTPAKKVSKP